MSRLKKNQKVALVTAAAYTAIMGLGMYVMHHIVGSSYEEPDMPKTLFWFEIVMTMLAVVVFYKYFRGELAKYKTKKPRKLFLLGFAVMIVNMLITGYIFFFRTDFSGRDATILAAILGATVLVGFSEELVFRGIVLPAYLQNTSAAKAVLISSFLFSIFHVVNILGGVSVQASAIQLLNALLLGITFGFIAVEMGRIWPLMIFHAAYDFFLIAGGYAEADTQNNSIFGAIFAGAFGVVMLAITLYSDRTKKSAGELQTAE